VKYEVIIVRYGEIGLKAKATKRIFENKLINHIKSTFVKQNISYKIQIFRGRIYIYTDQIKQSIIVLQKIFGITSISPAVKTSSKIDSMVTLAIYISKNNISKKNSFALRVSRTGTHSFTSQDIAIKLGNEIVNTTGASVNLTNPNFELYIEIRDKDAYFFIEKIRGIGGLPYGSQGKVLALIDKKQSILASWYMLRRGCKIVFSTNNQSLQKDITSFSNNWHLNNSEILLISNNDIETIANKYKCEAVVTGNNIEDFSEIEKLKTKIKLPILTPLISMNKKEILEKTKEIGLHI
jgi:thiamine biosynthesis protein ThiI